MRGRTNRRSARSHVVWALVVLVAATLPAAPAEGADKVLKGAWFRVESDHLIVYGDGSRASVAGLARDLEIFRTVALGLLPNAKPPPDEKVVVFALRDGFSLERYGLREMRGRSSVALGWAVVRPARAWLVMVAPSKKAGRWIGFHEYAHYITRRSAPFLPSWLTEGLAEYWGTLRIERDGALRLGGPNHTRLKTLHERAWPDLELMLSVRSLHGRPTLYAMAWAFAQYAATVEPALTRALPDYLARVRGDEPAVAFEAAFGRTPRDMHVQLEEYVRQDRFAAVRFRLKVTPTVDALDVRRATVAEVGTELGMVHLVAGKRVELARALFERVLEEDPRAARAIAGLAVLDGDEHPEVTARFDRALEAAPEDGLVLRLAVESAIVLARRSGGDDSLWGRVVDLLRRTTEAEPRELHAARLYGELAIMGRVERKPAIVALERSLASGPTPGPAAEVLHVLYLREDRREDARLMHLRLMVRSDDPEFVGRSLRRVVNAELRYLDDLLRDGRGAEAAAHCLELRRRSAPVWAEEMEPYCDEPTPPL